MQKDMYTTQTTNNTNNDGNMKPSIPYKFHG